MLVFLRFCVFFLGGGIVGHWPFLLVCSKINVFVPYGFKVGCENTVSEEIFKRLF